ncbi:MAG: membrane integrity-associated transporter subunit PqiC [Hydrogenophaga sp.]|mgnify:CR=1 FL=1|nr:membrane integrity-associated transporter subunit PqiC [Hydrogenophaga sp.]
MKHLHPNPSAAPQALPSRPGGVARRLLPAAVVPLLLAACAGTLLPKPASPPARFTLDAGTAAPPPATAQVATAGAPALTVDLPRAAPGYDSRRMVYQRRPQQLEAFAFNEWVEPPAQMLAPLLVRALQDSGGFRAVLRAPSAAAGGWRLETELLRLHQDFSQRPSQVRLSVRAVLLNSTTRQAVAWREFDVSVAAASEDPVAGAAAAQAATQQLLAEVATFCAEQVREAARTPVRPL